MQNFLMIARGIAESSGFSTATRERAHRHVDARDVAAKTAALPAADSGKTYWPTGPEALSFTR
jgi:hypothetical protein